MAQLSFQMSFPQHLFTSDVDGQDVRLDDCIEQLKLLEAMGRVWGQEMMLQMRDGYFQLIDIESKVRRILFTAL